MTLSVSHEEHVPKPPFAEAFPETPVSQRASHRTCYSFSQFKTRFQTHLLHWGDLIRPTPAIFGAVSYLKVCFPPPLQPGLSFPHLGCLEQNNYLNTSALKVRGNGIRFLRTGYHSPSGAKVGHWSGSSSTDLATHSAHIWCLTLQNATFESSNFMRLNTGI